MGDDKELQHHGADPAKVAGPRGATQKAAGGFFIDPGAEAFRVHLFRQRVEDEVGAVLFAHLAVRGEGARITGKILLRAELAGIDENAHRHRPLRAGQLASAIDERGVAGMERAHGGDQHQRAGHGAAKTPRSGKSSAGLSRVYRRLLGNRRVGAMVESALAGSRRRA